MAGRAGGRQVIAARMALGARSVPVRTIRAAVVAARRRMDEVRPGGEAGMALPAGAGEEALPRVVHGRSGAVEVGHVAGLAGTRVLCL